MRIGKGALRARQAGVPAREAGVFQNRCSEISDQCFDQSLFLAVEHNKVVSKVNSRQSVDCCDGGTTFASLSEPSWALRTFLLVRRRRLQD